MKRAVWSVVVAAALAISGAAKGGAQDGPPPLILADPSAVDFGEQPANQTSEPRRVTITNGGQASLYVNSVTLEGENAEEFALASDRCTGATLAPGKSCVVDVVLTPAAVERRTASLSITGNSGVSTQRVDLSGTGINSAAVPPR